MQRAVVLATVGFVALALAGNAFAAAPDGVAGPWADFVVASQQGPTEDGGVVPAARSNPQNAVGPAEAPPGDDPSPGSTFFSLGFEGSITLGFDNPICNGAGPDIEAREITLEPYPNETVNVFVSNDGVNFVLAGQISKDGSVGMPASVQVAHYVRLVDVTDRAPFVNDPAADGFDVDGVKALSTTGCEKLGLKGCTPGYWKQPQHFDSWPAGIEPSDLFGPAFLNTTTFANITLLAVLEQGGGGSKALGRHAVAALLNALSPSVDYPYTSAQVQWMVFTALASGDAKTIEATKDQLEDANQRNCPLN